MSSLSNLTFIFVISTTRKISATILHTRYGTLQLRRKVIIIIMSSHSLASSLLSLFSVQSNYHNIYTKWLRQQQHSQSASDMASLWASASFSPLLCVVLHISRSVTSNLVLQSGPTNFVKNRYTRFSTKQSEEFNTASRSVKPGLIASGIVSAWTWAATLLQSGTVAYEYGVAGPFWVCC